MQNTIRYKGYYTIVKYDADSNVLYGKIEDIDDLVTFECTETSKVKVEFEKAVDDYLEMCLQLGKSPSKTYNGIFNVRVSPDLHRRISYMAKKHGVTLNAYVNEALEYSLNEENEEYVVK